MNFFSEEYRKTMIPRLFRMIGVAALDVAMMVLCAFAAIWVRFDFSALSSLDSGYVETMLGFLPIYIITYLVTYYVFRLYHSIWRYAGVMEVARAVACYIALIPIIYIEVKIVGIVMPRSFFFLTFIMNFLCCVGIRLSYRFVRLYMTRIIGRGDDGERIMVVGGGAAGRNIIKEIQVSEEVEGSIRCVIDDNAQKWRRSLEGVPIVGGRYDIPDMVKKYHITRIIYAIPSAPPKDRSEILNICKETGCQLKAIPAIYQLINGEVSVAKLKDVDISDLLGREEIHVNNDEILSHIGGKVIMVTGGGGSIGSELCRQIAAAGPKQLIIFDIYENNAYAIQQELIRDYPGLNLSTLIGSVRNTGRVDSVLSDYHPDIIYHAAAHKHVPLMEDSPNEAIKNNVMGTYKLAEAAAHAGVKKFLLISTDKAVNPTNLMGASKRLCEMVIQMENRKYAGTDFVAVRFGNVLGSNGSVIPLFKKQIAAGGPVTVTDKHVIRYFMTIPEAVSLVLQAGYYARGGEIFVLDMGEPVRIDDMARNLIKLSGLTPDVDIKIVYTGLRPGEKLFEELLMDEEGMTETANKLIYIGKPIEMDDEVFEKQLDELDTASREESDDIKSLVASIVDTYHAAPAQ